MYRGPCLEVSPFWSKAKMSGSRGVCIREVNSFCTKMVIARFGGQEYEAVVVQNTVGQKDVPLY